MKATIVVEEHRKTRRDNLKMETNQRRYDKVYQRTKEFNISKPR